MLCVVEYVVCGCLVGVCVCRVSRVKCVGELGSVGEEVESCWGSGVGCLGVVLAVDRCIGANISITHPYYHRKQHGSYLGSQGKGKSKTLCRSSLLKDTGICCFHCTSHLYSTGG